MDLINLLYVDTQVSAITIVVRVSCGSRHSARGVTSCGGSRHSVRGSIQCASQYLTQISSFEGAKVYSQTGWGSHCRICSLDPPLVRQQKLQDGAGVAVTTYIR